MIEAVTSALEQQSNLLVSAPTGIGKTVAALYASLRFAARHGLSVFFLTSKTTQQKIVADTLRLWNLEPRSQPGSPQELPIFNSLVLRSKEKICANDVVFCHESRCRYARAFFRKLEESSVRESLLAEGLITPEKVYAAAVEQELCPFELSLEMLKRVDLTVCDYNYIYDPAAFDRMESIDRGRAILIVDEAHNLYSRAREYFSPELALTPDRGAARKSSAVARIRQRGGMAACVCLGVPIRARLSASIALFPGPPGRFSATDSEAFLGSPGILSGSLRVRACSRVVGSRILCRTTRRAG